MNQIQIVLSYLQANQRERAQKQMATYFLSIKDQSLFTLFTCWLACTLTTILPFPIGRTKTAQSPFF